MRVALLPLLLLPPLSLYSQTSPGGTAPGTPSSSSGPTVPQPSVGSQTYSVEGDILGYKAIQSDGEAIASDLAGVLADTATVDVANGAGTVAEACKPNVPLCKAHILVLSSNDQTLANYQMWRLALLMIDSLQRQATSLLPAPAPAQPSVSSLSATETAISSTLTLLQTVLSFFVSNESVSGIQGSPQDLAIINATSRQLRVMGARVVVPTLFSPLAFSGLNYAQSPFLSRLNNLQITRGQLAAALTDKTVWDTAVRQLSDDTAQIAKLKADDAASVAKHKPPSNASEISRLSSEVTTLQKKAAAISAFYVSIGSISNAQLAAMIQSIDGFTTSLLSSGTTTSTPNAATAPTSGAGPTPTTPGAAPSPSTPGAGTAAASAPATPSSSAPPVPPAATILLADGLARMFGATPTNLDPDVSSWRVLTIKEMEIGATVVSRARFFGTNVFYGGGAVASYSLFDMKGNEYCSANLFDYGGRLKGKEFNKQFRANDISPTSQLIFSRGSCSRTSP